MKKKYRWCKACGKKFRRTFKRVAQKFCNPTCRSNQKHPLKYRLGKILDGIQLRCEYPYAAGFQYYGGKGIKCLLTKSDIWRLWYRDNASRLDRPSIDRIDSNGHYEYSNCRFIELSDNSRRVHKRDIDIPGIRSWMRKRGILYKSEAA